MFQLLSTWGISVGILANCFGRVQSLMELLKIARMLCCYMLSIYSQVVAVTGPTVQWTDRQTVRQTGKRAGLFLNNTFNNKCFLFITQLSQSTTRCQSHSVCQCFLLWHLWWTFMDSTRHVFRSSIMLNIPPWSRACLACVTMILCSITFS